VSRTAEWFQQTFSEQGERAEGRLVGKGDKRKREENEGGRKRQKGRQ